MTDWIRKSLGKERTFGEDVTDIDYLRRFLSDLLDTVWQELEQKELRGRTVTVKVKYADFRQVTRSRSFLTPIPDRNSLQRTALELLKETEAGTRPVRLIGASVSSFDDGESPSEVRQLSLSFGTS